MLASWSNFKLSAKNHSWYFANKMTLNKIWTRNWYEGSEEKTSGCSGDNFHVAQRLGKIIKVNNPESLSPKKDDFVREQKCLAEKAWSLM